MTFSHAVGSSPLVVPAAGASGKDGTAVARRVGLRRTTFPKHNGHGQLVAREGFPDHGYSLRRAREVGIYGPFLGRSQVMIEMYERLLRVATTDMSVLLSGATGTGKELAARAIHDLGSRRERAFVAVNCGAIPAALVESELFGHERGSFTGANNRHNGVFTQADKGTLFLDEITEMSADQQVKLLRVLETGSATRIGGEVEVHTDVRVIASTNRSPEDAVRAGLLRADLFYRLRGLSVALPPLHSRGTDIDLLALAFLTELNGRMHSDVRFTEAALDRMRAYDWPGNVRELRSFVAEQFVFADAWIHADSLRSPSSAQIGCHRVEVLVGSSIAAAEKLLICATMEHFGDNRARVAEALGVSLATLGKRLATYRLDAHGSV